MDSDAYQDEAARRQRTDISERAEPAKPDLSGWKIKEAAFPVDGTQADKLRFLAQYAVLAPSNRNSQPWLFKVRRDTVELYADNTRALPTIDPQNREMVISCGAALFYLRVALRHFGYLGEVELAPFRDSTDPDLLARVRLGSRREPDAEDDLLFQAIPQRHTHRLPFRKRKVPEDLLLELKEAAREEHSWLYIVDDIARRYAIADEIAESDARQWEDQRYRSEVAGWVRPNDTDEHDGIPGYALGLGDVESGIAPLVMDAYDLSEEVSRRDYKLALLSPVLAVLGTVGDTRFDWLATGQALAKVLLRATAEGVSAAFFNQAVEVAKMREVLARTLGLIGPAPRSAGAGVASGGGYPQIIMRMGYPSETTRPTPRRPVDEVFI